MTSALVYLTGRSLANRLRTLLARAVRPRYLLVYLLGIGYLWLVLLGPHPLSPNSPEASERHLNQLAALMTLLALRWWLMEDDRSALAFTPAELTFLFPAPLTRSQLIRFKVMRVQFFLLVNTLFWTVAARRTGFGAAPDVLRAISLWVCFGTLYLHRLGAALTRGSLASRGVGQHRPPLALWLLVSVLGLAPVWFLVRQWPVLGLAWRLGPGSFVQALTGLADQPGISAVLYPMKLLLRPSVAPSAGLWLQEMVPAVLLLLAHFAWVIRADFEFEEAALNASSRAVRRLARGVRSVGPRVRRTLPLPVGAGPAMAVAWKNLVCQSRSISLPTMLALGIPLCSALIFGMMEPTDSLREVLGWFGLFWAVFLVLIGPQWIRYDLRKDLGRMDLLRSYPVSGAAIMTGEIAASALILSAYQLLLLSVALGGLWHVTENGMSTTLLSCSFAASALLVLPVNWLMVAIYNAGALLYPEWVRRERRTSGVEAMGQSVMGLVAAGVMLGLGLVIPVLAGGVLVVYSYPRLEAAALLPGALVAMILLLLEARLLAGWLGRRFDIYDLSMVRLASSS
ncbi:MAG: putative ABC exporter domain-containing protein [Gemmatimonadota bacterium]